MGHRLKLLEHINTGMRAKHYSERTAEAYIGWIKRFIFSNNKRREITNR
ncbi:MAG: phage integrase N-terminal SAM-like domain-containing protein [Ignavibacteriales bacterium]|nr:phage integrase N-terminal SAM-like domain-containing protein [Ignavibacteriales bacterium]